MSPHAWPKLIAPRTSGETLIPAVGDRMRGRAKEVLAGGGGEKKLDILMDIFREVLIDSVEICLVLEKLLRAGSWLYILELSYT
jgi:hypothetical protein